MRAGSLCTREVDVARADESVQRVATRMHQRNVGTVVVTDDGDRPIGIVTDRDLAVRVVGRALDAATTPVGDVMTLNPKSVGADTEVDAALFTMQAGPFRRVIVVDRQGVLVGVLSLDDLISAMARDFDRIRRLLARESPQAVAMV